MRNPISVLIGFVLVLILTLSILGFLVANRNQHSNIPTSSSSSSFNQPPSPTVTSTPVSYCQPEDLQPLLNLDPGAGNVYGTLTLKNISNQPCQIPGGNFIEANYNSQRIKNITTMQQGQPANAVYQLAPNKSLYSQIHYPNGPQCSSGIITTQVTFTYSLSPTTVVTFLNQNGNKSQSITTCKSPTEMTTINVWSLSTKPITP